MGIVPFDYFCDEYRSEGRWVYQQELNLTNEEKAEMRRAFDNNFLPETGRTGIITSTITVLHARAI